MERKPCPKCGAYMIQRDEPFVFASYPAQTPWKWWCACGHTETGGVRVDQTEDDIAQQAWRRANGIA